MATTADPTNYSRRFITTAGKQPRFLELYQTNLHIIPGRHFTVTKEV
jgi:hypothetical protein